jgi:hypothetical protein
MDNSFGNSLTIVMSDVVNEMKILKEDRTIPSSELNLCG